MKSVTQLRIRYRVVTPAFLGGADPSSAELRPPSIKAALRFWYRDVDPEFAKRDVQNGALVEHQAAKHRDVSFTAASRRETPPSSRIDRNARLRLTSRYCRLCCIHRRSDRPKYLE